jgi:hypothetical protein
MDLQLASVIIAFLGLAILTIFQTGKASYYKEEYNKVCKRLANKTDGATTHKVSHLKSQLQDQRDHINYLEEKIRDMEMGRCDDMWEDEDKEEDDLDLPTPITTEFDNKALLMEEGHSRRAVLAKRK